ncbi:sulfotransferase [Donghicola sp. XS_ASV15]|uniref:sulfotransferase n=1 Tax=Donghicola sp. XS_ASV15 TaxID=3241295 RepID=UPI0035183624
MTLKFLVCGLEHTGTTLVTELFRQIPHLDSGFECGVLLNDSPADFVDTQPFANNMLEGWGITHEQLEACCQAKNHDDFYRLLMQSSSTISDDTTEIFDKTPRYLFDLENVLRRAVVPAIVTYKDPRAIVYSDYRRASPPDFYSWFDTYSAEKISYMQISYMEYLKHLKDQRVISVGLEALTMNARPTMEAMFSHVGKSFELSYAIIPDVKFDNVRSNVVSADIAFEFRNAFTQEQISRIEKEFSYFDLWFYN